MKRNVYVGVLLTALLMTSCINTKRIVYLEDMKESLSYPMNAQPEMKINGMTGLVLLSVHGIPN